MSARIVVNFRDGTKREWPPKGLLAEYYAKYENNMLIIYDRHDQTISFPLDTVASVEETPRARF